MMKCAIGFVVLIACILLSGCGLERSPLEKPNVYTSLAAAMRNGSAYLQCFDGVLYINSGHALTAKIHKDTLQPERCK